MSSIDGGIMVRNAECIARCRAQLIICVVACVPVPVRSSIHTTLEKYAVAIDGSRVGASAGRKHVLHNMCAAIYIDTSSDRLARVALNPKHKCLVDWECERERKRWELASALERIV